MARHGKISTPGEPFKTYTIHPFGRGYLSTNGIQYSDTGVSNTDTFGAVETVTVENPTYGELLEIETAITWDQRSEGTTEGAVGMAQARNEGGTWVDLMEAVATNTTIGVAYQEMTYSGIFPMEVNFNQAPFDMRVVVRSSGTTENAVGRVKSSSYVTVTCDNDTRDV